MGSGRLQFLWESMPSSEKLLHLDCSPSLNHLRMRWWHMLDFHCTRVCFHRLVSILSFRVLDFTEDEENNVHFLLLFLHNHLMG